MQKRVARTGEQLLKRKTVKGKRIQDAVREGIPLPAEWFRLVFIWITVIALDVATGIRFELFWPFVVVAKLAYAAVNKDKTVMVTLANTNTSHMSMLFVCITATADLICYLFIPLQWILFLSCTYVWISCLWATYGGFLLVLSTYSTERSRTAPLFLVTGTVVMFEWFVRQRCDLATKPGEYFFLDFIQGQGCEHIRNPKSITSGINGFFGAHCIGYPFILISLSLRYFLREWTIRRRESKISRRNEQFYKVLTESLPAIYEGPRDYSIRQPILEEECDLLGSSLDLQPMLMAPPLTNGNVRKTSKANGMRNRQNSKSKAHLHHTPPNVKNGAARRAAEDGYEEDSDEFLDPDERNASKSSHLSNYNSLMWVRPFVWLFRMLAWVLSSPASSGSALPEPDHDDEFQENGGGEYKKGLRNGDSKSRAMAAAARKGRTREKPKEKVITTQPVERDKVLTQLNGGPKMPETRDSSRDTSLSTTTTSRISVSMEVERLKSECNHLRNAEQDSKLQLVAAKNTENQLRGENTTLKASVERSENRIKVLEKQRDGNVSNMTQLEKKYAELLNKKNDIERELNAERKARKEDGGRKEQTAEQLREREREQEAMIERLKQDAAAREERFMSVQKDLYELRKFKESEVMEKEEEIRSLKSRIHGLEESLQSENKLKQDLFRALGDARTHNAQLEDKLRSSHELSVNVHHQAAHHQSFSEKSSPRQTTPPSSVVSHQPPPYNMIMQQKCSDTNIGSPYLYTAMHQHHSSPTGEHLLFEQSSVSPLLQNLHQNSLHDLAARMGKFGAPANPARIN